MTQKNSPKSSVSVAGKPACAPPPPQRDRRLPLKSAQHVRSELARVYRDMKTGEIEPSLGTKLTYVLVALGRMIEVGDLEKRIDALETVMRQP